MSMAETTTRAVAYAKWWINDANCSITLNAQTSLDTVN